MKTVMAVIALTAALAEPVFAQPSCPTPTPDQIHAKGVFEAALLRAKALGREKSEFETTASYQANMAGAVRKAFPDGKITFPWPAYRDGFSFDADAGMMVYRSTDFTTSCSANLKAEKFMLSRIPCIEETYKGMNQPQKIMSNGYGVKVRVSSKSDDRRGILFDHLVGDEREAPRRFYTELFKFSTSPEEARSLKSNAVLVITMRPSPPLFVAGSHYHEPTIDSPYEIYGDDSFLFGSITCLSITDGVSGKTFQTISFDEKGVQK